jgi:hypothetical protein
VKRFSKLHWCLTPRTYTTRRKMRLQAAQQFVASDEDGMRSQTYALLNRVKHRSESRLPDT